jgi:predicted nucleotide-binding protein (sugar kinase/HSP70/actin superfamily)
VARQTQSQVVIPPNPGTVGALGIALLAYREISSQGRPPLDLARFLRARIEQKETFVCKATVGCGGPGNRCRIDCLRTVVEGQRQKFTWGGGCALYDKGTRKKKLPDRSPDPFREREELLQELIQPALASRQRPRIAITDEFSLKGLFPFYTSFLHHLGFDLLVMTGADQADLKRGIQDANVPFCAPMQLYHGLVSRMAQQQPDYLFLPMLRGVTRVADEEHAVTCPIVQASPDMLRWDLGPSAASKILSPVINIGAGNLDSPEFLASCRQLALDLGVTGGLWRSAHQIAQEVQTRFEMRCEEIGRRALSFCAERGIAPVVVLGRVYTIYSNVLNSNVPAILREQGAIGIPVDCYPVAASQPIFRDMYWGYGQRILRAAHQIRRTPGVYSLYCSNYSCGPDSFNLHFYSYIMEGKPFAIIETDGHSGDAGTKTRVEAFLYCVEEDRRTASRKSAPDFRRVELEQLGLADIRQRGERLLVPSMGPGSEAAVVCLRGIGVDAECLPLPDRETVRMGRRYTSGKECLPVCITLGSLLQRLQREPNPAQRFAFLMPRTHGPCRLGTYNVLNRITLERLHWIDRVRIWSPADSGYFVGTPPGFAILAFTGFMASDLLSAALLDVRPSETRAGAAQAVYRSYWRQLLVLLETQAKGDLSAFTSLRQVISGQLFGVQPLLRQAAADFSAIRAEVDLPTVLLVGEIYMRCDPFTNDFIVEKLEARGLRVRLAPFNEWLEYVDHLNCRINPQAGFSKRLSSLVQKRIQNITYAALAESLGWPRRTTVPETLRAAGPFIREALQGEAVLTLGGPVHDWRQGHIDAVLSVGPLECMPNKIAEAQFFHAAETERLLNLTLSLNGEPADPEVLDNFAFEVHARHRQRRSAPAAIKLDPDAKRPSMSSPTACRQAAQGQPELTQS